MTIRSIYGDVRQALATAGGGAVRQLEHFTWSATAKVDPWPSSCHPVR
jgi:hypothetical protein